VATPLNSRINMKVAKMNDKKKSFFLEKWICRTILKNCRRISINIVLVTIETHQKNRVVFYIERVVKSPSIPIKTTLMKYNWGRKQKGLYKHKKYTLLKKKSCHT